MEDTAAPRRGRPRLVSVLVPCRNGAQTLSEQLEALAGQTYRGPWELLVVDNGSTDGSAELARSFAPRVPVRVHPAPSAAGVGAVRNAGVAAAEGDLLAVCDADDVVAPGWLDALVRAAGEADLVAGRLEDTKLNDQYALNIRWYARIPSELMRPMGYLPFAPGCAMAVWRDVVEALDGWATDYGAGSEDVDFSWRAQEAGYLLGYAPEALVHYRYRRDLRSVWRQFHHYGITEAQLHARFRGRVEGYGPVALVVTWAKVLSRAAVAVAVPRIRGDAMRDVLYHLGRLRGSVRYRSLVP